MKSAENGKRGKKLENRLQELLDEATTECMGVRQVDHAKLIHSVIEECAKDFDETFMSGGETIGNHIRRKFDIE
jgi:hypothetical protein